MFGGLHKASTQIPRGVDKGINGGFQGARFGVV